MAEQSSRWRPYPAYQLSGLPWLGDIPAHWEIHRLKNKARVTFSSVDKHTVEGEVPVRLCNYVDVYNNDFITPDIEFMKATASPDEVTTFTLREGDVLITKDSESWNDIAVSAYVSASLPDVVCGYHLALIRPRLGEIDGKFLLRAFQAKAINYQFEIAASGITRYGIGKNVIENALFLIPPLPEQRAIAAFLDRETAHLDALIAKKERLIELLGEKRAAVISQAVTKGLDPTVPMKDSGVPWLEQIPAHWETMMLKRVSNIRYGLGQPPPEILGGVPLIRATNINSGHISEKGMLYVDPSEVPESRKATLSKGEIIVVRSGAYTGDSALIPTKYVGAITGYDMVVTIHTGHSPYFAWQFLGPAVRDLQFGFSRLRAAQPHLNAEELKEIVIMVPPFHEQYAITAHLDRETAKFDALIAKVREGIEKLREYRAALIAAAVTGKIDVRGVEPLRG